MNTWNMVAAALSATGFLVPRTETRLCVCRDIEINRMKMRSL